MDIRYLKTKEVKDPETITNSIIRFYMPQCDWKTMMGSNVTRVDLGIKVSLTKEIVLMPVNNENLNSKNFIVLNNLIDLKTEDEIHVNLFALATTYTVDFNSLYFDFVVLQTEEIGLIKETQDLKHKVIV